MNKGKHSVLIVDDQGQNISLLTKILSPEYTVLAAKNGHDAIEVAGKFIPDIILLDILMPDMDGYAVLSELKKRKKTQDTPVIFITGLDDATDEEKGLSLGAADYIKKPFSQAIVKLRVHNQIKMIEQLRLIKHLSMVDQLTKLPNRPSFEEHLKLCWGNAARNQTPIGILVVDIDMFNSYNEQYGRSQGDAALCSIAETLKNALSVSGGIVARWSGEEFIALVPNTDADDALAIAEDLRNCVAELVIPDSSGAATKLTVSIGVSVKAEQQNITMDEFISEADSSLHEAKNKVRNRIYFNVKK